MFKRGRSNDTDHTEETDTTPKETAGNDNRGRSRWRNLKEAAAEIAVEGALAAFLLDD